MTFAMPGTRPIRTARRVQVDEKILGRARGARATVESLRVADWTERPMDPSERALRSRLAAYKSWGNTKDRSARTAAARKASTETRFINQARELHPDANDEQIRQAADALRKAYFTELALRSVQARRIRGQGGKTSKGK
jgi:hypothetical protein